jgi:hypothetical protein
LESGHRGRAGACHDGVAHFWRSRADDGIGSPLHFPANGSARLTSTPLFEKIIFQRDSKPADLAWSASWENSHSF